MMVAHAYNPRNFGSGDRRIVARGQPRQKYDPISKTSQVQ
jgi:hypothetical protein